MEERNIFEERRHANEEEKGEPEKIIGRTTSRNLIREVNEEQWEEDGFLGEGKNKKRTYTCKRCLKEKIRRDHRKVHSCF